MLVLDLAHVSHIGRASLEASWQMSKRETTKAWESGRAPSSQWPKANRLKRAFGFALFSFPYLLGPPARCPVALFVFGRGFPY